MKKRVIIEVGTTPADPMFTGPPIAYIPGSTAKKPDEPPPAPPDSRLQQIDERLAKVIEVSAAITKIYTAIATTPKRRGMASRLASIIAWLWDGDADAGRGGTHFRNISDEQLRRELTRLSYLGENSDVVDEVKHLHQRTIVALADFGFAAAHHVGQHDLDRVVAAAKGALRARAYITTKEKPSTQIANQIAKINESNRAFWEAFGEEILARQLEPYDRAAAEALLARLRAGEREAKPKQPTTTEALKGAPLNNRAAAARRMLGKHYRLLTGRRPTMTGRSSDYKTPAGGRFFKFTKSVFAALNIKASIEAQTRQMACPQRKKAKKAG